MRILLIMDPGIPVPPINYGGIERIVALLAGEYLKLGHEVHILASEGSYIKDCTIFSIGPDGFPAPKKVMNKAVKTAWIFLWKNRKNYDLIHNFGRLIYLLPVLNSNMKKIMCYQREITKKNIVLFTKLPNKNLIFCGCSADLINRKKLPGKWFPVYNGVKFSDFKSTNDVPENAPFIFLGRIDKIKGCHTAIKLAIELDRDLIIAGNISSLPEEKAYFANEILPLIDNNRIKYVGEVNDIQKSNYLSESLALLMPIEWNEPFGIVMIESMACGTPVLGYSKGSVPEVIDNGITGFKVKDYNEMILQANGLKSIDRHKCRESAAKKFDISIIAEQYLALN